MVLRPDGVPFIDRRFDCRDLLQRSVIHYGSRKAVRISGVTGMARCVNCRVVILKMEALAPVPPTSVGAFHFGRLMCGWPPTSKSFFAQVH